MSDLDDVVTTFDQGVVVQQEYQAIVCFSGGQDSTTVLAEAVMDNGPDQVLALTADYGQRHRFAEISASQRIAEFFGVKQEIVVLSGLLKGTSPLVDEDGKLETYRNYEEMDTRIGDRRELTFVPMRNPLFLTVAANRASVYNAGFIWTGVCQMDNANYDDCREDFIARMEQMINYALGADHRVDVPEIGIMTPLMDLSKAQSVRRALEIPGAYEALAYSHTAYSGEYPPLTQDHATVLRAQGFLEAGVPDPLIMRAVVEGKMPLPTTSNYPPYYDHLAGTNDWPLALQMLYVDTGAARLV